MKYFKWLLLTPQDIAKILGQRRRDRAVKFVLNDHKCRTAVLCGLEGRLRGNATAKTANILKRELRQFNGHTGRWDTKEGLAAAGKLRKWERFGKLLQGYLTESTEICTCSETETYVSPSSGNWFCVECKKRVL